MTRNREIEAALDARHGDAAAALARRDLPAYRDLFSANLRYRQADGRVIGRDQLIEDVRVQFDRLDRAESRYTREALEVEGPEVTEVLLQTATARSSAFKILHRTWRLTRRGRYRWSMEGGQWKIVDVHVMSEEVRGGWNLGR